MKKSSNIVKQAEVIIKNYANQYNKRPKNNKKYLDHHQMYHSEYINERVMDDKNSKVFPFVLIFLSIICITLSAFCFLQCIL